MKTKGIGIALIVAGVTLSGCAKINILKSLDVSVAEQNTGSSAGEQYITMTAKLDLGNAVFGELQIPVLDPQSGLIVGQLGLSTAPDGMQNVSLGVNASVVLHADRTLGSTLPNGRELPASLGASAGEILGFPILRHSRVYIGGDLQNRAFIGVALAVNALDDITNNVGASANVFFGQQFSPQVYGIAGLYGSPVPNRSGVAIFGRLNLQREPASGTITTLAAKAASSAKGLAGRISNQAISDSDVLSPRSERKVTDVFYGRPRVLRVR